MINQPLAKGKEKASRPNFFQADGQQLAKYCKPYPGGQSCGAISQSYPGSRGLISGDQVAPDRHIETAAAHKPFAGICRGWRQLLHFCSGKNGKDIAWIQVQFSNHSSRDNFAVRIFEISHIGDLRSAGVRPHEVKAIRTGIVGGAGNIKPGPNFGHDKRLPRTQSKK